MRLKTSLEVSRRPRFESWLGYRLFHQTLPRSALVGRIELIYELFCSPYSASHQYVGNSMSSKSSSSSFLGYVRILVGVRRRVGSDSPCSTRPWSVNESETCSQIPDSRTLPESLPTAFLMWPGVSL